MSNASLGPLVRLRTLTPADIPPHPAIKPVSEHEVELYSFLKSVLDEAVAFTDSIVPATFREGAAKASAPSSAKVKLLSRDIKASELPTSGRNESWFARRSIHKNERTGGTADIAEFDEGLRDQHSKHEMEYTPDVFDAHKVADWDDLIAVRGGDVEGRYREVSMSVYEMCHKLPFPCLNRVFCVLVVTAKTAESSFVVVQIPIDLSDFSDADVLYGNGRNKRDAESALKRKKVIVGEYVSIERVTLTEDGDIQWVMATASDAKGWLPMPMQKLGVPGAVVKDVGLFMKWTRERRGSQSQ
ncbi:uncharacterized protein K452DRAFT_287314 [Aplosporella prunicola CBS 121167]|uniref:DUF3074 domain-containing protein n=1 Tax=Aplosporella prunicola CBS 121167 TaxID=1176127 RepID=A0A6A6BDI0_9PEZI|nr:uncharacterized protein K452DRAFT_287314 [Aplosporella prunicola CBS 121167]KAF2142106.1 hypothetical protein K452DRAFT_287314 [Aplosporella prunicola CBS 121167]